MSISGRGKPLGPHAHAISHVVIRREFLHMASTIQRLFTDQTAVQVFADRRWCDRRAVSSEKPSLPADRRRNSDRRQATPVCNVVLPVPR